MIFKNVARKRDNKNQDNTLIGRKDNDTIPGFKLMVGPQELVLLSRFIIHIAFIYFEPIKY